MRRRKRTSKLLWVLPTLFMGCGEDPAESSTVVVTDSAGVTIVHSASPDVTATLTINRSRTLGGQDTPEESFFRVGSWNVATDAADRLYVLDRAAHRVQVFELSGRHIRTMGGAGGGPGELQVPFSLTVTPEGHAWVADVGKRALVHWGPDGEVLESRTLPEGYSGGEVKWTSGGLVANVRGVDGQRLVIHSDSGEETTVTSIPRGEVRALQLASCGMSFSGLEPIFSPNLVWAVSPGAVAVARSSSYAIDIFEEGRLVRSLRRDLPLREATVELAKASLGDGMRVRTEGGERVCDPAEVVEQQGFAPHVPMVAQLALAPDGALWVRRFSVGEEPALIDVFVPAGGYLGTLPEGSPFPIGFSSSGEILVSEADEFEVERLVVMTTTLHLPRGSDDR